MARRDPRRLRRATGRPAQQGISLLATLVLLVFVLLLGVTAVRSITQQERMTTAFYDRGLAFAAAEATLRVAEERIETAKPTPTAGCASFSVGSDGTQVQVCAPPLATDVERWRDDTFDQWAAAPVVGTGSTEIEPEYFVEYLGSTFPCQPANETLNLNCKRYRVTARVVGEAQRASVMLQSVYATN